MLFDFVHALWVISFITVWALISQFAFIKPPRRRIKSDPRQPAPTASQGRSGIGPYQ